MKRRSLCWSLILLPLSAGVAFGGDGPAELYESALNAAESGRTESARRGFERLIRYYPHHIFGRRAYLDLAQLHHRAGRSALALRVLDEARESPHASKALRSSCREWRQLIKGGAAAPRVAAKARPAIKARSARLKLTGRRVKRSRAMPRVGLTIGQIQGLERVLDKREEDLEKAVIDGDDKEIERLSGIISRLERRLVQMLHDFDPQKAAPPATDSEEDPELVRLNRALQKAIDALNEAHEQGDAAKINKIGREVSRLEAALGMTVQDTDGMRRGGHPPSIAIERAASAAEISRLEEAIDAKLDAFDEAHDAGKLDQARALYDEVVALERQLHRVLEGGWTVNEDEESEAEARKEAERQASRRLLDLERRIEGHRAALEEALERGETRRLEDIEKQLEALEDQVEALLEGRGKAAAKSEPSSPRSKVRSLKTEAPAVARRADAAKPRSDDDDLSLILEDMREEARTLREAGELEMAAEVEAEIKELQKAAAPAAPRVSPPARLRPLPEKKPELEDRLGRVERGLQTMNARLEALLKRLNSRSI